MARRRRICFIDDDQDELSRTMQTLSQNFVVGVGPDLDTAIERLESKPDLFLLDMYYGPETKPEARLEVTKKWNELSEAQSRFYDLLRTLKQSSKGGFDLADHVRTRYPGVPIVFFTRKGSLEDADYALRKGAASVLKKPDATSERQDHASIKNALDDAMAAHKDELVRALTHIADQNSWLARHARLRGFIEGVLASLIATLLYQLGVWSFTR